MYDSKVFEEPRKTKEVLSLDCAVFGLDAWNHYNRPAKALKEVRDALRKACPE